MYICIYLQPHIMRRNYLPISRYVRTTYDKSTPRLLMALARSGSCATKTWGAEVETPPKKMVPPLNNRQKQNVSWVSDIGVCHSMTGAGFPYNISFSTIWYACASGALLVQIKTEAAAKNAFVTNKVKNEYQQPRYLGLPPSPTSRTTSSCGSAWCRSWAMSLIEGYAEFFSSDPPAPLPRKNMILRCCQNWNIWHQNVQICFECYVKIWL